MFGQTESEDQEMVDQVAKALHQEIQRQNDEGEKSSMRRCAVAAIEAMVRWAREHPPARKQDA